MAEEGNTSNEISIVVAPTKRPRKKPEPKLQLAAKDERDLIEWYREHELLYNPQHAEFKDKGKKQRILDEKAQELAATFPDRYASLSGERLGKYISSLRSQYSRLRTKKSG